MNIQVKKDPVPAVFTGPRSVKCDECQWEGVWIVPEEVDIMILSILQHIQQHGIKIPTFQVDQY